MSLTALDGSQHSNTHPDPTKVFLSAIVVNPLSAIEILRLCSSFICTGLGLALYIQYAGSILSMERQVAAKNDNIEVSETTTVDSLLMLPFYVGLIACPATGILSDKTTSGRSVFLLGCLFYLTAQFLIGQFPSYGACVLFIFGLHVVRTSASIMIWQSCIGNGIDKYGQGYAAAALLEFLGLYVGMQTASVSWSSYYNVSRPSTGGVIVPPHPSILKSCTGFCIDLKFSFQLLLPIITALCASLVLLSPVVRVSFPTLMNDESSGQTQGSGPTPGAASSSSTTVTVQNTPPRIRAGALSGAGAKGDRALMPRSGSGARLTYFLSFFAFMAISTFQLSSAYYISQDLYLQWGVDKENERPFGSPLYEKMDSIISSQIENAKKGVTNSSGNSSSEYIKLSLLDESKIFTSTLWSILLVSALVTSFVLFMSKLWSDRCVIARLLDVANNFLAANLLISFLFVFFPRRSLILIWGAGMGINLALHAIMPQIMVTSYSIIQISLRFLVPSPAAIPSSRSGKWLGGLYFIQSLAGVVGLTLLPSFQESFGMNSYSAFYVILGTMLFLSNQCLVNTISNKEEELSLIKTGMPAPWSTSGWIGNGSENNVNNGGLGGGLAE